MKQKNTNTVPNYYDENPEVHHFVDGVLLLKKKYEEAKKEYETAAHELSRYIDKYCE